MSRYFLLNFKLGYKFIFYFFINFHAYANILLVFLANNFTYIKIRKFIRVLDWILLFVCAILFYW